MSTNHSEPPDPRRAAVHFITAALILNLGLLLIYLLLGSHTWFNSDAAIKSVLAGEILRSGEFFPRDFVYSNGDLWILHGHLPLLALIPLLGNSLLANAFSSLLFCIALLGTLVLFLRRVGFSVLERRLTLLWATTGFSTIWAAMMFGQAAYGYVVLLTVWAIWATVDCLLPERTGAFRLVLLLVVAFLIGCYGTRGLLSIAAPIAASVAFGAVQGRLRTPPPARLIVTLVLIGTGALFRRFWIPRLRFNSFQGSFTDLEHLDLTPGLDALAHLFGLFPDTSIPLSEISLAIYPLRLLMLTVLLATTMVATLRYRSLSAEQQLLLGVLWTLALLSVYLLVAVPRLEAQGRYLVVPAFIAILLGSQVIAHLRRFRTRAICLLVAGLLGLSYFVYAIPALHRSSTTAKLHFSVERQDRFAEIIDALRSRSVSIAYATYWHSTVISVLSGGNPQVYPIVFEKGSPKPSLHLSVARWYLPNAGEPVALVLTREERDQLDTATLEENLGAPYAEASAGSYSILIFNENRFAQLPGWMRTNFEHGLSDQIEFGARRMWTTPSVGIVVDDVLVSTGSAGALAYGPYLYLTEGYYRIVLRFQARGAGVSPGRWDIARSGGLEILDQGTIAPAPVLEERSIERVVAVPRGGARQFEIRLFASGAGEIRFRSVRIERCATLSPKVERPSSVSVRTDAGSPDVLELPLPCRAGSSASLAAPP